MAHIELDVEIISTESKKGILGREDYLLVKLKKPFWEALFLQGKEGTLHIEESLKQKEKATKSRT